MVNVQGDLPTIEPATIRAALAPLDDPAVDIATLGRRDRMRGRADQPERGEAGRLAARRAARLRALYFTRATAP